MYVIKSSFLNYNQTSLYLIRSHEHRNSTNDSESSFTSATWSSSATWPSLPWSSSRGVTLWSTFLQVLQELTKLLHGFVNHLRPGYSHTIWDAESLSLWWLSNSILKWYCNICFFGHEMPCASMYYNATLAQPWPRGVHTLRKHMRQV